MGGLIVIKIIGQLFSLSCYKTAVHILLVNFKEGKWIDVNSS